MYGEEADLCLRANRAGHEVHFVRDSRTCHIGSMATGMKTWTRTPPYWFESRWYYYSKNYSRAYALSATALNVLGTSLWRVRRWLERKPNTDSNRFLRDLIAHDVAAVFRPTPKATIREMQSHPDPFLQPSVD